MKHSSTHLHRVELLDWRKVDDFLKFIHAKGSDVLDIGPAGMNAYIHYREVISEPQPMPNSKFTVDELDELYRLYPRKAGKKQGLAKLAKIVRNDDDYNGVQKAILNFTKFVDGRQKEFIPYFSTFVSKYLEDFKEENYSDETEIRYGFLNG